MLLDQQKINKAHALSKMIEVDGVNAIESAAKAHGENEATIALVSYLRREAGACKAYPTPDSILGDVDAVLKKHGLLPTAQPSVRNAIRAIVGGLCLASSEDEAKEALQKALIALDPTMAELVKKDKQAAFSKMHAMQE